MACIIIKEHGYETVNISITGGKITLGRSSANTVVLRNKFVSGTHCEIAHRDGAGVITDLGSTNGLFVNGRKVKSKKLKDGDKILAGTALIIYIADEKAFRPKQFLSQLRGGAPDERELAASLLGQFGSADVVDPLVQAVKDDPAPRVKAAAAEALGHVGDPRAAVPLLAFFDAKDTVVRNSVVGAIVRLADMEAIDGLVGFLKHKDQKVRVLAAHSLGRVHNPRATEQLIKALDDDAFVVREAVVKALGDIADPRAGAALMRAASDPKRFSLIWVIESLGKIRNPGAIQIILKAMGHRDAEVREAAASALGGLRAKEAAPAFLKALDDSDPRVRESAASALEKLRIHLEMAKALDDTKGSGRKTIEIAAIGEREETSPRGGPKFGEDRSKWDKWWLEHAEN